MLEAIQLQAPDALEVRSAHTTRITVSGGFRAWLPLFLHATDPSSSPELPEDWSEFDDYANRLTNLGTGGWN